VVPASAGHPRLHAGEVRDPDEETASRPEPVLEDVNGLTGVWNMLEDVPQSDDVAGPGRDRCSFDVGLDEFDPVHVRAPMQPRSVGSTPAESNPAAAAAATKRPRPQPASITRAGALNREPMNCSRRRSNSRRIGAARPAPRARSGRRSPSRKAPRRQESRLQLPRCRTSSRSRPRNR